MSLPPKVKLGKNRGTDNNDRREKIVDDSMSRNASQRKVDAVCNWCKLTSELHPYQRILLLTKYRLLYIFMEEFEFTFLTSLAII